MSGRRKRAGGGSGFSLVEVTVSTALVGLMLVAALEALRGGIVTSARASQRARANLLASDLLGEILGRNYVEPVTSPVFGPEADEATQNRTAFDDVDDYHGWTESPPQHRTGVEMSYLTNWRRGVVVEYVSPGNPNVVVGSDQGAKRITVTVEFRGSPIATATGLRTNVKQ
jgi:MSHA pilin protein MshD